MDPCPSCDADFPDFDGQECRCGYRRRSRKSGRRPTGGRRAPKGIVIKEMAPDDIPAVIEALKVSDLYDASEDTPLAFANKQRVDPHLMLVARTREAGIVGFTMASYDQWCGFVWHLAVIPSRRGEGIGKALSEAILSRLRAMGATAYYSLVLTTNTKMLKASERAGMTKTGPVFVMKGLL